MKILIPTCNKYLFLIENLIFNFSKYWPDHYEVIILGYEEPKFNLPDKWSFISLGDEKGPQEWSNDLIKFFETFEDEYFINFIDDTLLTKKVRSKEIFNLIDLIKSNKNISKIFLHGSLTVPSHLSFGCKYEDANYGNNIVKITNDSIYRTSIQSSILKTSFFKRCLQPNMNPWAFESQQNKYENDIILSIKNDYPMMIAHLFRNVNGQTVFENNWPCGVFDDTKLDEEDLLKIKEIFQKENITII